MSGSKFMVGHVRHDFKANAPTHGGPHPVPLLELGLIRRRCYSTAAHGSLLPQWGPSPPSSGGPQSPLQPHLRLSDSSVTYI